MNGTTAIVVANDKMFEEHTNIFVPIYIFKNPIKSIHTSMLQWCESKLKDDRVKRADALLEKMKSLPKQGDTINFTKGAQFKNVTVKNLKTKSLTVSGVQLNQSYFDSINKIKHKFDKIKSKINKLDPSILTSSSQYDDNSVGDPQNQIESEEPIEQNIMIENLYLNGSFNVKYINGHPLSDLLHTYDNFTLNSLTTDKVIVQNGINVGNTINSVKFDDRSILLDTDNQELDGYLDVGTLVVDKLKYNRVNNKSFEMNEREGKFFHTPIYKSITVKNLTLHGLINNIDIDKFAEKTLKKSGNQMITAPILIRNLTADNIFIKSTISGIDVSDIIQNEEGASYNIEHPIRFESNVEVNQLEVYHRINNIRVIDGKLDLVLRKSPEVQHITGIKLFHNVTLKEPMHIRGRLKSNSYRQFNPVFTTDQDLHLEGDYIINGPVTVVNILKAYDVHGNNPSLTMSRVDKHGLLLSEPNIKVKMNFTQPIHTNNVYANVINGINTKNFLTKTNNTQIVTGQKTFKGDLWINGKFDAANINNININELEETTWKINGDQNFTGRLRVKEIRAKK